MWDILGVDAAEYGVNRKTFWGWQFSPETSFSVFDVA